MMKNIKIEKKKYNINKIYKIKKNKRMMNHQKNKILKNNYKKKKNNAYYRKN